MQSDNVSDAEALRFSAESIWVSTDKHFSFSPIYVVDKPDGERKYSFLFGMHVAGEPKFSEIEIHGPDYNPVLGRSRLIEAFKENPSAITHDCPTQAYFINIASLLWPCDITRSMRMAAMSMTDRVTDGSKGTLQ